MLGSNREVTLEARVLPQSFDSVLDDPHQEVGLFDFFLCALDLQAHLPRDQPLQVPEKLLVLDIADSSINRRQLRRAGDRRGGGGRARGRKWGRGNNGEWQWQGKQRRIKIDVLNIKDHSRVPSALSTTLNRVFPVIYDLGEYRFRLG